MSEQDTENAAPGEQKRDPLNEFLRHQQRAFTETGKAVDSLFPPGFKEHSEKAGREFVSGMKVLVDAAIDGLQKASKDFDKNFNRERRSDSDSDDDDRPSSTGATKVKVQVD